MGRWLLPPHLSLCGRARSSRPLTVSVKHPGQPNQRVWHIEPSCWLPPGVGDTRRGLLCGQLHGVRLCTGGQWIAWIVGQVTNLSVEKKLHGVLSRASLVRFSSDPNWSTGAG